MPRNEMQRYASIQVPWRGMERDLPRHMIPDGKGFDLANFLPGYPGQLIARRAWTTLGTQRFGASTGNNNIIATIIPVNWNGPAAMITAISGTSVGNVLYPANYISEYQRGDRTVTTYSSANGFVEMRSFGTSWGDVASSTAVTSHNQAPDTQWAEYEQSVYFTSTAAYSEVTKQSNTASSGRRLSRWAGVSLTAANHANSATVNNGSTAVTLSAAPTGRNLTNYYMIFNSENVGFWYGYRVLSHTTGATTLTLAEPYGLGENTTNVANKAGAACVFRQTDTIRNSPKNATCVINHLDRLFVGRPTVATAVGSLQPYTYQSGIQWSEPGQPQKWPDTNIAIVGSDADDQIMGFATVGNTLVVFKRKSTYLFTGDGEATFSLRLLSKHLGCIDSRAIVYYRDMVIWPSLIGVHMMGPDMNIVDLTKDDRGGGGISRLWRFFTGVQTAAASTGVPPFGLGVLSARVEGDHLYLIGRRDASQSIISVDTSLNMICHIPTRAWARLTNPTSTVCTPQYITQRNTFSAVGIPGATPYGYVEFNNVLQHDPTETLVPSLPPTFQDTASDLVVSTTTSRVRPFFRSGDIVLRPGDTASVKQLQVRHGYHYINASTAAAGVLTTVAVESDAAYQTETTAGTFGPRRVPASSYDALNLGLTQSNGWASALYVDPIIVDATNKHQLPTNVHSFRITYDGGNLAGPTGVADSFTDYRVFSFDVVYEDGRQGVAQTKVT